MFLQLFNKTIHLAEITACARVLRNMLTSQGKIKVVAAHILVKSDTKLVIHISV